MSKDDKSPRKPNRTRRITPENDGTVNLGLGERKFVGDPDLEVNARLVHACRDDWDRAWRAGEFPLPNETDAEWLDRVEEELLQIVQEHLCPVPPGTSEATVFLEYAGSVLALDLGNGPTLYHLPEAYPEDARGADGMADAVMLAERSARQTAFQGLWAVGVLRKDGSLLRRHAEVLSRRLRASINCSLLRATLVPIRTMKPPRALCRGLQRVTALGWVSRVLQSDCFGDCFASRADC